MVIYRFNSRLFAKGNEKSTWTIVQYLWRCIFGDLITYRTLIKINKFYELFVRDILPRTRYDKLICVYWTEILILVIICVIYLYYLKELINYFRFLLIILIKLVQYLNINIEKVNRKFYFYNTFSSLTYKFDSFLNKIIKNDVHRWSIEASRSIHD